jgi:hypothetical protein
MGLAYDLFLEVKRAQAAADVATMRTLFAADATMYEPYVSGTVQGPGVAEYLGTICGTEFAALDYVVLGSIGDGDRAAVELDEMVTLFDGTKVHLRNCTIVECREGVIARWYEYLQPMKRRL